MYLETSDRLLSPIACKQFLREKSNDYRTMNRNKYKDIFINTLNVPLLIIILINNIELYRTISGSLLTILFIFVECSIVELYKHNISINNI